MFAEESGQLTNKIAVLWTLFLELIIFFFPDSGNECWKEINSISSVSY